MPGSIPEIGDKFLCLGIVAVVGMFVGKGVGRIAVSYDVQSSTKI